MLGGGGERGGWECVPQLIFIFSSTEIYAISHISQDIFSYFIKTQKSIKYLVTIKYNFFFYFWISEATQLPTVLLYMCI